jgi:EAL domain-containing protein (putative c-di-GMP-specific phosphodiesterase class I)/GGDEF domain-containing protein
MLRFHRLRTKLTVLYAGLFAGVLLVITVVVYSAVASNAAQVVRGELAAGGGVFDRIWALRTTQLQTSAGLLARDFGFRSAIATHDSATLQSALENLKARLGIDTAFMIGADGAVTVTGEVKSLRHLSSAALSGLEQEDPVSGVFVIDGSAYQVISTPVLAPMPLGWVVFANRLDRAQMAAIERLSAIPLDASILYQTSPGVWRDVNGLAPTASAADVSQFINASLKAQAPHPDALSGPSRDSIGLIKPLHAMADTPVVLMLRYPLARAMAPYRLLLWSMLIIGAGGIALVIFGSWALARGLTRPISALEDAARRLQDGDAVSVEIGSDDEIGRLAERFNSMAAGINERERRITHLALHDADTGLPNRSSLAAAITHLSERVGDEHAFVAAIGIDRFEPVRGAIGHVLFGAMMRELGVRLTREAADIHPARLSTATLGVAFEAADLDAANARVERLRQTLEAPIQLGGNTIDVSLTVGLSHGDKDATRVASMIDRATIALDQARAARRPIALFDADIYGDPSANLSLMSEMRRSIDAGEMRLYHQPKYDLRQRAVVGVEALVRWQHPKRGFLTPDSFIGMAEETGHIRALTDWVLRQAVIDQRAMADVGRTLAVSVNISGRLLGDAEFADSALAIAAEAVGEICFEITETAVIENPELALDIIARFSSAGIAISIDDYGTGLSSLAYLKQIRANELKIDKSFVLALNDSQRDALLVRSTIDLAHSLGLKVTAEGVETETALALLAGMGCDLAQGYLIAKPMPIEALPAFLAADDAVLKAFG